MLSQESVSVKTQDYLVYEGKEYPVGQPHRKAYLNSIRGREEVSSELPNEQQQAIFAIWGENPKLDGDKTV